jgi:hypothetical protein
MSTGGQRHPLATDGNSLFAPSKTERRAIGVIQVIANA